MVVLSLTAEASSTTSLSRSITILNESGSRIEVYWIHPETGEGTLMSTPDVLNGANFPLNSFVGHQFEIRELPGKATGVCKSEGQVCRNGYFTVSENDDQSTLSWCFFSSFKKEKPKDMKFTGFDCG